ncbi:MAG: CooT family nickel-binding protein [Candidatus Nezhaarchaeota archaeon]|nr:CooT family nickel-binding protein [Candidatus Nezhaarchaeota archaeon]MCX8141228.1 CooT family nickel-binding protein [Candidatus Nezhaarchaeota archaeon]MDW8049494.1 CooT family nickel-binding protein [Nitrososphaerota archaeon]
MISMCEFKVYTRVEGKLEEVARGVVKAMMEGKSIKLITILGEVKKIDGVIIESVDVPNERMVLVKL